jgi:hypothetical protein
VFQSFERSHLYSQQLPMACFQFPTALPSLRHNQAGQLLGSLALSPLSLVFSRRQAAQKSKLFPQRDAVSLKITSDMMATKDLGIK